MSLCECGCGEATTIATRTARDRGWVKGQPLRFVRFHHLRVLEPHAGPYKDLRWREEDRGYKTPCHIWQMAKTPKGYGQEWCKSRQRMVGAHILAWEREHGPVPKGKELDHLCRQRDCVRAGHLEPVAHLENIRRGDLRHRPGRKPYPRPLWVEEAERLRSLGKTYSEISEALDVKRATVAYQISSAPSGRQARVGFDAVPAG
jgi:hypothetical protein